MASVNNDILDAGYDKYKSKNIILRILLRNFINTLRTFLELLQVKDVLEVGCGKGHILREVINCKIGVPVFGIDIDSEVLKSCQMINAGIPLMRADVAKLPLRDKAVELVVCLEVLEHLRNPDAALLELNRVGAKYLILSVPNQPFFRVSNFLRGRYVENLGNEPAHLQLWTAKEFISLVGKYFRIIKIAKPFPWVMLLCQIN